MVQRKAPAAAWDVGGGAEPTMKTKRGSRSSMAELAIERSRAAERSMPNYMKSTSSSNARSQQRTKKKVTLTHRHHESSPCSSSSPPASGPKTARFVPKKSSSKSLRVSTKKKSLGGIGARSLRPVVNRATCSSTLKDSRFPRWLELSPGGTEAEGTSSARVCSYKYCSLNGHLHGGGVLPPLKCFLASRRKVLKSQKQMKQKGVSPLRKHGAEGQAAAATRIRSGLEISSLIEEIGGDFFVEIYAKPPELFNESGKCDDTSIQESGDDEARELSEGLSAEDDRDRSSEFSVDDLEVMMSFLEYVSCDREDEFLEEKPSNSTAEDRKESKIEAGNQIQVLESFDIHLGEDADPFSDDRSGCSDDDEEEDELGPIFGKLFENDPDMKSDSTESVSDEKDVVLLDHGTVITSVESKVLIDRAEEDEKVVELSALSDVKIPASNEELLELEEGNLNPNTAKKKGDKLINTETTDSEDDPNLRCLIITRRERDEEVEQLKEFNPRGPNFLPEEPESESERVDLKHQLMDERKNAEEWMIDYALQQAVTKLGPAKRQKVALLVEAFETVTPIPPCEKPLSVHQAAASFSNPRPLQAC